MDEAAADPSGAPAARARETLSERAYLELEERIATLQLAPGEVLSEGALSQALGIGRTPVREALQRLAREGLVTVLPRRGILVSTFNVQAQLRMLEVRRAVEGVLVRSAAARARDAERAAFETLADDIERVAAEADDIGFMRLDKAFNELVSQAARNEFAAKAIALMAGLSRRFWFMHHSRADDLTVTACRHADVARAIAHGDVAGAGAANDALLDHIESITRSAVDW